MVGRSLAWHRLASAGVMRLHFHTAYYQLKSTHARARDEIRLSVQKLPVRYASRERQQLTKRSKGVGSAALAKLAATAHTAGV